MDTTSEDKQVVVVGANDETARSVAQLAQSLTDECLLEAFGMLSGEQIKLVERMASTSTADGDDKVASSTTATTTAAGECI